MEFDYKTSELTLEETFEKIKDGYKVFPYLQFQKKSIAKSRIFNEKTILRNVDFSEKKNHIMKLPYLNEREEKNYKEDGLKPFRGFYHYIYFTYNKLPFGIVELIHIYEQYTPQAGGTRFDKTRIMNKKEIWMYSDDESNENDYGNYVLISAFKDNDDNTQEYLKRMKMITSLYEKPEEELSTIEDKLIKLKAINRNKSVKSIKYYLEKQVGFLENDMSNFLKIVYSYGRLNKPQIDKIEKKIGNNNEGLLGQVVSFQEELKQVAAKYKLDETKYIDSTLEGEIEDVNQKYIKLETDIEDFKNDNFYSYFSV